MSACGCHAAKTDLRPVDEAIAELLKQVPVPPKPERVPLAQALGRTLALPIHAASAMPAWDNSAMDGYALRAADLPAGEGWLPLAGRIAAGDAALAELPAGTAVRIFTGAPSRTWVRSVSFMSAEIQSLLPIKPTALVVVKADMAEITSVPG